jgi:hypothetical protein
MSRRNTPHSRRQCRQPDVGFGHGKHCVAELRISSVKQAYLPVVHAIPQNGHGIEHGCIDKTVEGRRVERH